MDYTDIIAWFENKGYTSYVNTSIVAIGGNTSAGAVSFGKVYSDGSNGLKWLRQYSSANFVLPNPSIDTYASITSIPL